MRYGLPGVFMLCLDGYGNFSINILAGWISVNCQAAQAIVFNIMVILYMQAMGLEQATCALVGQQLGRNAPVQARIYYRSFRYIAFWFIVITTILFWVLRVQIINLFTHHKEI